MNTVTKICRFYHPQQQSDEQTEGIYDNNFDLQMQIQLGSKLYAEYPITSLQECYYHLRKALNLPMFHQHSLSIDFRQYRDRQFVVGFFFEKVFSVSLLKKCLIVHILELIHAPDNRC